MTERPLIPAPPQVSASPFGSFPSARLALKKPKHRRVKTGCRTCRIRKIKCDEIRPRCTRCISAGRECVGYPNGDEIADVSGKGVLQRKKNSEDRIPFKPSNIPVLGRDPEKVRLFEIFHRSAILTIPGHTPMRTWRVLIPQLCLTEPVIANAALAIASLHEEAEIKRKRLHDVSSEKELTVSHAYALRHYGIALNELGQHLKSPNASPVIVLVACIIFTSFEALRGQSQAAIAHIKSGNKILEGLQPPSKGGTAAVLTRCMSLHHSFTCDMVPEQEETRQEPPPNLKGPDMNLVATSLTKLSTLMGTPEEQALKPLTKVAASPALTSIKECPQEFKSLDEARGVLFALMNSARQVIYNCMILAQEGNLPRPDDSVPRCVFLDTQLRRWSSSLDCLLQRDATQASKDPSIPAESSEIVLMQLWRKFISVRLWASILPSRASLDALTPDFEELLNLVERCLNLQGEGYAIRMRRKDKRAPVFIMDMGVLPILFFTSRKCTYLNLRWRAVRLIDRAPRREALWDAETVKTTVIQILDDEERASTELEDGRLADMNGVTVGDIPPSPKSSESGPPFQKDFPKWQEFFFHNKQQQITLQRAQGYVKASFAPDAQTNSNSQKSSDCPGLQSHQLQSAQNSLYNIQVSGAIPRDWNESPLTKILPNR